MFGKHDRRALRRKAAPTLATLETRRLMTAGLAAAAHVDPIDVKPPAEVSVAHSGHHHSHHKTDGSTGDRGGANQSHHSSHHSSHHKDSFSQDLKDFASTISGKAPGFQGAGTSMHGSRH